MTQAISLRKRPRILAVRIRVENTRLALHAALVFPHQLYADQPALRPPAAGSPRPLVVLIEEPLLFTQYPFHRQKLILHRASMRHYEATLKKRGLKTHYLPASDLADTHAIGPTLKKLGVTAVQYVDPCDDWLSTRLAHALQHAGIAATALEDPHFLTPHDEIDAYASEKPRLFFTDFYIRQRKRLGILLTDDGRPLGGKWSFDAENRRRLPKNVAVPPTFAIASEPPHVRAARQYVETHFPRSPGQSKPFAYPIDHAAARNWLDAFLKDRLALFGDYEDAIAREHDVLFHSVLTPMLNIGLLTPRDVIDAALTRAEAVPLNSLEGFLRQVIGWREFVRLVYLKHGRAQRTTNFWNFTAPMPRALYTGDTGIEPVDATIRKVLRLGWCHHIERLMILSNFMLLCEIHPDAVYQWFMELFVDAYDWVMVPNIYGMGQHADGGRMTTKPYLSGSAYVLRMSDFKKGPWCDVWDALYWRFIDKHAAFFEQNPRTRPIVRLRDKLGPKLVVHHQVAESFLAELHGQ